MHHYLSTIAIGKCLAILLLFLTSCLLLLHPLLLLLRQRLLLPLLLLPLLMLPLLIAWELGVEGGVTESHCSCDLAAALQPLSCQVVEPPEPPLTDLNSHNSAPHTCHKQVPGSVFEQHASLPTRRCL
jgi:hypothetical protein